MSNLFTDNFDGVIRIIVSFISTGKELIRFGLANKKVFSIVDDLLNRHSIMRYRLNRLNKKNGLRRYTFNLFKKKKFVLGIHGKIIKPNSKKPKITIIFTKTPKKGNGAHNLIGSLIGGFDFKKDAWEYLNLKPIIGRNYGLLKKKFKGKDSPKRHYEIVIEEMEKINKESKKEERPFFVSGGIALRLSLDIDKKNTRQKTMDIDVFVLGRNKKEKLTELFRRLKVKKIKYLLSFNSKYGLYELKLPFTNLMMFQFVLKDFHYYPDDLWAFSDLDCCKVGFFPGYEKNEIITCSSFIKFVCFKKNYSSVRMEFAKTKHIERIKKYKRLSGIDTYCGNSHPLENLHTRKAFDDKLWDDEFKKVGIGGYYYKSQKGFMFPCALNCIDFGKPNWDVDMEKTFKINIFEISHEYCVYFNEPGEFKCLCDECKKRAIVHDIEKKEKERRRKRRKPQNLKTEKLEPDSINEFCIYKFLGLKKEKGLYKYEIKCVKKQKQKIA
jgi:hypothetical protein